MSFPDALILGVLQGITEFLPISSSGHLVLGETLLGLRAEALKSFDVAVHMGTLLAILVYFRADFLVILRALIPMSFRGASVPKSSRDYPGVQLLFYIVIGTVPAVLAAVFFEDAIDTMFRDVKMVASAMIAVGFIFFLGEFVGKKLRTGRLTIWKALIIGLAQAVALIPGVSRSGLTITAGLFQGIKREEAARFSFLLGAPAIFGAGIWTALKSGMPDIDMIPLLVGFSASAVSGFLAVSFLMRFLKKHSLGWFGAYLIVVGTFLHLA